MEQSIVGKEVWVYTSSAGVEVFSTKEDAESAMMNDVRIYFGTNSDTEIKRKIASHGVFAPGSKVVTYQKVPNSGKRDYICHKWQVRKRTIK